MENDNTKKIWEKPELKKLGLEMEHCCVAQPGSPEYIPDCPDGKC